MQTVRFTALVLCVVSVVSAAAACRAEDAKEPEKVLRHCVFFKFKDGTDEADVDKIVAEFDALPKKIDSVKDYARGKNVSKAGLDDGFTHCFFVTFADEAGRAKYLPHPEHQAFIEVLKPHLDKAFVVDFWGKADGPKSGAAAPRVLKHALFLKYRDGVTDEQKKGVQDAIVALPSQCPAIKGFEWGKNNSPEDHDEGFTDCFMFTFNDGKGLKDYAQSTAHTALVVQVLAVAEKGRVLDFWTKEKSDGESK